MRILPQWGIGVQVGQVRRLAPSRYRPVKRHMQPPRSRAGTATRYQRNRSLGVNPPTPKLRREVPLRRGKARLRPRSDPQPHAKNPQISWGSTWPTRLERMVGWWSLERAMGFEPTTPTLASVWWPFVGVRRHTKGPAKSMCWGWRRSPQFARILAQPSVNGTQNGTHGQLLHPEHRIYLQCGFFKIGRLGVVSRVHPVV